MLQFGAGEFVQAVGALAGVQQVVRDHRVAGNVRQVHSLSPQYQEIVLDVLVHLADRGVFEDRLQGLENRVRIEDEVFFRAANGKVICLLRLPGEGVAHGLGEDRIEARRFQVEDEPTLLLQVRKECVERGGRIDEPVVGLPVGVGSVGAEGELGFIGARFVDGVEERRFGRPALVVLGLHARIGRPG